MIGDGPLPRPWRHYIAMLGASRHNCEYLCRNQMYLFLKSGGDIDWILNAKISVPKKLQSLVRLNGLMAHRPWAMEPVDIEQVLTIGRWSKSELVHAIVILATYQSMSALVFGSGIKLEFDLSTEEEFASCSESNGYDPLNESDLPWTSIDQRLLPLCFELSEATSPGLIQRLLMLKGNPSGSSNPSRTTVDESSVASHHINAYEGFGALNEAATTSPPGTVLPSATSSGVVPASVPPPVLAKRLDDEAKEELSNIMASSPLWRTPLCNTLRQLGYVAEGDAISGEGPMRSASPTASIGGMSSVSSSSPSKRTNGASSIRSLNETSSSAESYRDFLQKHDKMLHTTNFSWEDHGMMIMARQIGEDITDCIDDEYNHCLEFSTNSIGDLQIGAAETATVREAIVKYVQRMYGIFHDDYRYDKLNKILPVIDKAYLKKLACFPERVTKVDYMRMRTFEKFNPNDMVHLAHIVFQTKRLVTLTWTMHALMNLQGGGSSGGV